MEERKTKLEEITLRGFKSFNSEENTLKLGDINVLIGPNGSGKSNAVSFFEMLDAVIGRHLQSYIAQQGFSHSFLHYGSKVTQSVEVNLKASHGDIKTSYGFSLKAGVGEYFILTDERISAQKGNQKDSKENGSGGTESTINQYDIEHEIEDVELQTALLATLKMFEKAAVFRFHDTSENAGIKQPTYINDNRYLHPRGENLSAFLFGLQQSNPKYYKRIVKHIQMAMPQFGDFELKPMAQNPKQIVLDWMEEGRYYVFGSHQISDGSLRFMALATLLLQPPENMPSIIVIDEPELGLHPSAISILASMVRQASRYSQVIIATQSPALLDEFEPEHIRIIDRDQKAKSSRFKNLNQKELEEWLKEFSLSEIWEKNIIGGTP